MIKDPAMRLTLSSRIVHRPFNRGPRPSLTVEPNEQSPAVFLEFPVPIIQRADLARFEPARDAVEVERMLDAKNKYVRSSLP